jgi:hypothetical protein
MVARSVFRSANWLTGFKAAAVVVLIDNNGLIIARSDPPQHGWADAMAFGKYENTVDWTYQFDPIAANNADNIGVLHFPDETYLSNLTAFLNTLGGGFITVIKALQGSGGANSSYDPTTETGGGGGSEGQPENASWALMGAPWQGYTAQAAPTRTGNGNANPNAFQFGAPTSITVHAADAVTNAPIDGLVYVGTTAVGNTDIPFTYTWNPTGRGYIDPNTHRPIIVQTRPDPMTVRAQGYSPITVPYTIAGGSAPWPVRPPRPSV